ELDVFLFEEAAEIVGATVANADAAENDPLARRYGAVSPQGGSGDDLRCDGDGAGGDCGLQKTTPMYKACIRFHRALLKTHLQGGRDLVARCECAWMTTA